MILSFFCEKINHFEASSHNEALNDISEDFDTKENCEFAADQDQEPKVKSLAANEEMTMIKTYDLPMNVSKVQIHYNIGYFVCDSIEKMLIEDAKNLNKL